MHPSARDRFAAARVARLATVTADGRAHVVPLTFVLLPGPAGDVVWSAVDAKPKTTLALRRLANIAAEPRVSLLVDHYADDWAELWWVRADGHASVVEVDAEPAALAALTAKYPPYATQPPPGPLVRIDVDRWTSWSAR